MWLKNESGDIWNLRPNNLLKEDYCSFFKALEGAGFETKLNVSRIKYDFIVTEEVPQQVPLKGTMYFRSLAQKKRFSEFCGDFSQTVSFYYDPEGKIQPQSQLSHPWYKVCKITKLSSKEMDTNTGFFICEMQFTPLSAMWRRDTTLASTASFVGGDPHTYPHIYPYFYQTDKRLYLNILNDGERVGCKIKITNNTEHALETLEWIVTSGKYKQYAKWLKSIGLAHGRTLEIDSNPSTQRSVVTYGNNEDDVSDYQEANPQYINFVDIYSGNNQFLFNFGVVEGVQVDVTYTEQVRFL
jgi:hypothetical protein